MSQFLKLVESNGNVRYINRDYIVAVRPVDRKSFRESGAAIEVKDGPETTIYLTPPGEETNTVVYWLGIE